MGSKFQSSFSLFRTPRDPGCGSDFDLLGDRAWHLRTSESPASLRQPLTPGLPAGATVTGPCLCSGAPLEMSVQSQEPPWRGRQEALAVCLVWY